MNMDTSVKSDSQSLGISPVQEIIAELRSGRMVILVDEEDRENEGDLVLAADFVTPEAINFMVTHARGLVCLTLTQERCEQLQLPLMANQNGARFGTNFTVSIEAATGVSTGISAADRARTIQAAVARNAQPEDLVQPGHIFPVRAEQGGVLVRAGHTEAGCDLTAMAGLTPAAVICEILKPDGSMARLPDLMVFAQEHNIKIGTIASLIQYRSEHESMIERLVERQITTPWGQFQAVAYKDHAAHAPHLALVHGNIESNIETLVRVHEPTTVLDLLCSCDTQHSWTIAQSLETISQADSGVLVLLNCHSEAENVFAQFDAWARSGSISQKPKVSAEHESHGLRTFGIGAQILRDLGVGKARIMAQPRKMPSMAGFSLSITGYHSDSGVTETNN